MAREYSFKTEVEKGDKCFFSIDKGISWNICNCIGVAAIIDKEKVSVKFSVDMKEPGQMLNQEYIASRELFLEWQSRLIEVADSHKFKGDKEKMFGESNFSQWIPFYKEGLSPSTGYMVGMGLIDREAIGNED